ncbi:MAG: heparin lyase I family protein [Solirubrobacteraceae bacterium]
MRRFLLLLAPAVIVAALTATLAYGAPIVATSTPNCSALSSLSDSFETVYSTNGGLNPAVCYVKGTIANDNLTGYTWKATNPSCIKDVVAPTSGDGPHAIEVSAVKGAGVNGAHAPCVWANRWRYEQQNTDYYYGFMWYFTRGWVTPSGIQYELNFHPNICGAPVDIAMFGDAVKVSMRTGLDKCVLNGTGHQAEGVEYGNGGANENGTGNLGGLSQWSIIPKGKLQTGVWYEVILHIHWATDSTGQAESWYRQLGQPTWTQTIEQSGFPTLEWGCQPDDATQTCTNWTANDQNGITTVDHFGFYRYCNREACPADTFYLDNYQQQASFSAVANTMP